MMRKVYLEGELADKFGNEFDMSVSSFQEALQCFELNFQEFRDYMISCHERGIGFICSVEGEPLDDEEKLLLQYPEGSFTIQAVPAGSKSGIGKIIAAIIIIAVAWKFQWLAGLKAAMAAGGTWGASAYAGAAALMVGVNLAMAGFSQIMAPDPSVDTDGQQDETYLFQGSSQNLIEGDPVPVLYGKLRVPGRPISFEIKGENSAFVDYSQPGFDYTTPEGGDYQPDTGPDKDYDRQRDYDGDQQLET